MRRPGNSISCRQFVLALIAPGLLVGGNISNKEFDLSAVCHSKYFFSFFRHPGLLNSTKGLTLCLITYAVVLMTLSIFCISPSLEPSCLSVLPNIPEDSALRTQIIGALTNYTAKCKPRPLSAKSFWLFSAGNFMKYLLVQLLVFSYLN